MFSGSSSWSESHSIESLGISSGPTRWDISVEQNAAGLLLTMGLVRWVLSSEVFPPGIVHFLMSAHVVADKSGLPYMISTS